MLAGPRSLRTEGYLASTEEYLADPHLGLAEPYDEQAVKQAFAVRDRNYDLRISPEEALLVVRHG